MNLFGIYTLTDIPNLERNHRRFAEINNMEYQKIQIRNHYEKWALVYHLLENHPGETLVFIDAFSYFVSSDFDLDFSEPIIIQELHGKVMDNFFVVRSCRETLKIFHEIRRHSSQRFTSEANFLFDLPLREGTSKAYGYETSSGKRFNLNLAFTDNGKYFEVRNLPLGLSFSENADPEFEHDVVKNILVACYGGNGWSGQFVSEAEILCHHRPYKNHSLREIEFEIINPFKKQALVTLSCSEPGIPPPDYAKVSERNFRQYAEHQDVTLYIYKTIPSELKGLHSTWTKPYLVLRHLLQHEYVSWVDADMLISKDFHIPVGEDVIVYNDPGAWYFNAGFMTFRNSEKTIAFLYAVIARCELLDDRSSLYINGSDQTQFIEEYMVHFPDSLPRSNLVANIPTIFNTLRDSGPGLWHFMGLNPPSIRAVVMDYFNQHIIHEYKNSNRKKHLVLEKNPNKKTLKKVSGQFQILSADEIPRVASELFKTEKAIALCADSAFFAYTSVVILSLVENGKCGDIPIFVFAEDFQEADIQKFQELAVSSACRLTLVPLGNHALQELPSFAHMSRATYLRLLIPSILQGFPKILYLDSDLLVLSDLRELFDTDLSSHPVAAVRDLIGEKCCKIDFFKSGEKHYFNAGVLLINTKEWNRREISELVIEIARDDAERQRLSAFADQCLLNYILSGDFLELDKKFNLPTFEPRNCSPAFLQMAPTPNGDKLNRAKILHFTGHCKPWMPESSLEEIWGLYKRIADRSPWLSQISVTKMPPLSHSEATHKKVMKSLTNKIQKRWDYVSPNLVRAMPDEGFPYMIIGDVNGCGWPWLRREIPHNWYSDRRNPQIGFASRDEAAILYNTALDFSGRRCLEIGCWMGWSAAHLLLGDVELDIIDPIFSNPMNSESIKYSLSWTAKYASPQAKAFLHAGFSPGKVQEIAASQSKKWSFAFIDGDHEGDGPLRDAEETEKHLEESALVLFHDLASPFVARGLDYFRDKGWNTMIYNTMQIMGVAWRGATTPVPHQCDPRVAWVVPDHLSDYEISNASFNSDEAEFERYYKVIKPYTMVGRKRLKSLFQNALHVCRTNIPGDFVECGTCRGGSAVLLAMVIKNHSKTPRKVYACDTFEGMPEPGEVDTHRGVHASACGFPAGSLKAPMESGVLEIARKLSVEQTIFPVKGFFRDTLPILAEKLPSIALLHADGDWYESTADIFNNLYSQVVQDGFIQIDDYGFWEGCRQAVEDFQQQRGLSFNLKQIDETGFYFLNNK